MNRIGERVTVMIPRRRCKLPVDARIVYVDKYGRFVCELMFSVTRGWRAGDTIRVYPKELRRG